MREKELRLALVCYGGISLAVYMHGVTKEVWNLARASRARYDGQAPTTGSVAVFYELLAAIESATDVRLRVMADIVAGASAGGINGVFLARAVATGSSLEPLTDLWLECADVDVLIDPDARPLSRMTKFWAVPIAWMASRMRPGTINATVERGSRAEVRRKLSNFVRARWFAPPFGGGVFSGLLLDALDAMENGPRGPELVPPGQPVDLVVTVTDFRGHQEIMRLHSPQQVMETEHRLTFSFRHGGRKGELFDDGVGLACAARATASFPGAFPPFTVREMDVVLASRKRDWPQRAAFLHRMLPRHAAEGIAEDTPLIDGSVLANAPFRPAISALRNRPARREVDRRIVYIDPKPGRPSFAMTARNDASGKPPTPGFFTSILRAMSDIPREQPIRDNVEAIAGMSSRIRRMQRIISAMQDEVEERVNTAVGRSFFMDRPTPARLAAWRRTAQQKAASEAGYMFPAYGHLKLSGIIEEIVGLGVQLLGDASAQTKDVFRKAVWDEVRNRHLDRMSRPGANGVRDEIITFFRDHDLGFRIRRLRFLIRRLDEEFPGGDVPAGDAMRDAVYTALAPYLDRQGVDHYRGITLSSADNFINELAARRNLMQIDEDADRIIAEALAALDKEPRRAMLLAYLGYPFYDAATLPLLQGEGEGEYDEIKVDRISPDDAVAIRTGGTEATLKGIQFNSFGAFFSRAFRENDYLWGRLHGVDRLIDIVASAMPGDQILPSDQLRDMKRRAFHAVLDEEASRLGESADLIAELRREIG